MGTNAISSLNKDAHLLQMSSVPRRTLKILVVMHKILGHELDAESELRQYVALAELGHQVTCLFPRTSQSRGFVIDRPRFKLETVLLRKVVPVLSLVLFESIACWRVLRLIGDCDGLILDVHSIPALCPLILSRRIFSRSPVLLLRVPTNPVETSGHLRGLRLSFLYTLSIKIAAVLFDKILFISPMLGQLYSHQLGIPRNKIAVWPSPVDTLVFAPRSKAKTKYLREQLGLTARLGVLYHGLLTRGRGIMDVVEAFKLLKEMSVDASLILLGDGPLRGHISRYVQANRLEKTIQMCGPVEYVQVPDYVAACDVGIVALPDHPWWRYQCPTKVLENLAMNKPLIISDIPANRWIVRDAPVALYLKGTSPHDIADGVRSFMVNRDTLDPSLGRRIALDFSVENIAKMLVHHILSVMTRTAQPGERLANKDRTLNTNSLSHA